MWRRVNCERRLRDLAEWQHSGEDLHPLALPPASLFSCVCWRGLTRCCAHHGYTAVSVNDTHTEMCVCRHISYQSHTKTAKAFPACPLCSEPCIKAHYIFFLTRHLSRERRPSVPHTAGWAVAPFCHKRKQQRYIRLTFICTVMADWCNDSPLRQLFSLCLFVLL